MSGQAISQTPLALPPPRYTLLRVPTERLAKIDAQAATLPHAGAALWSSYHRDHVRALAYETTLLPAEKDHARWTELRWRTVYLEGLIKHHQRRAAA